MAYVAPNWVNGQAPALDAEALNAISQALAKLPMENGGTFATSGAAGLYNLINAAATLTSSTLASGDYVGVQDVSAGTGKRVTFRNLEIYLHDVLRFAKRFSGSYTGTGTYGASSPNEITSIPFQPFAVFIAPNDISRIDIGSFAWVYPNNVGRILGDTISYCTITWKIGGLSWYGNNANYQLNIAGKAYYWIAFG